MQLTGTIAKMRTAVGASGEVNYQLPLGAQWLDMNPLVGQEIALTHTGRIECTHCGCPIKKAYQQGYCFLATMRLAQCDMCILKPEQCHHHLGTCREPEWGDKHCMQGHYVYLSNASGLKVGITRQQNIPSRWVDQGAVQAVVLAKVATRRIAGLLEVAIKQHVSDKTDWRKMLKNDTAELDMVAERERFLALATPAITELRQQFGGEAVVVLDDAPWALKYPVLAYPEKVSAYNFDKAPEVSGVLQGIKGQYLLFGNKVLNMRKFTGYELTVSAPDGCVSFVPRDQGDKADKCPLR